MLEIQRKVEKKMEKKKIVLSYILTAGVFVGGKYGKSEGVCKTVI